MSLQVTRATPLGWPRISASLAYQDAVRAIDWLVTAFGFTVRIKVPDGSGGVMHSELTFGEGVVMVASEKAQLPHATRSPKSLGAGTQALFVYVDDIEAHYTRAVGAGGQVTRELATTDYGPENWVDRGYTVLDPEGHAWHFAQRISTARPG